MSRISEPPSLYSHNFTRNIQDKIRLSSFKAVFKEPRGDEQCHYLSPGSRMINHWPRAMPFSWPLRWSVATPSARWWSAVRQNRTSRPTRSWLRTPSARTFAQHRWALNVSHTFVNGDVTNADCFVDLAYIHNAIITTLLRQNDVTTSFWRNNDVIITSCVDWSD